MDGELPVELGQQLQGLLVEPHGLGRLGAFGLVEPGDPLGAAAVAPVDVGDGGEPGLESPGVEEVYPVDVAGHIVDVIAERGDVGSHGSVLRG